MLDVGDWVQALGVVTEAGFRGADLWEHAQPGDLGHVTMIDTWEGDDTPEIYWERTGTRTLVAPDNLKRVCSYSGQPSRFTFSVSPLSNGFAGHCEELPSLGFVAKTEDEALKGIKHLARLICPNPEVTR